MQIDAFMRIAWLLSWCWWAWSNTAVFSIVAVEWISVYSSIMINPFRSKNNHPSHSSPISDYPVVNLQSRKRPTFSSFTGESTEETPTVPFSPVQLASPTMDRLKTEHHGHHHHGHHHGHHHHHHNETVLTPPATGERKSVTHAGFEEEAGGDTDMAKKGNNEELRVDNGLFATDDLPIFLTSLKQMADHLLAKEKLNYQARKQLVSHLTG